MSARIALILSLSLLLPCAALAQGKVKHETVFQIGDLEFLEPQLHQERLEELANDANTVVLTQDLEDKIYRIAETMHLNRFFGVEGALAHVRDIKTSAQSVEQVAETETFYDARVRFTSFELFAHGSIPLWKDYILVYAKAGGSYTRSEYELLKTVTNTTSNTSTLTSVHKDVNTFDPAWGYGIIGVISDQVVLRADYTEFKLDHMEAESASFGIGLRY